MRYFSTKDSVPNVNDRFEFDSRKPWPSIYCQSKVATAEDIACWRQIEISDRVDAPIAPTLAGGNTRAASGRERKDVAQGPASARTALEEYPPLQLSAELLWPDVLAGDPLRLEVTLSSAAYQQALLQATATGAPVPPGLLHPTPATNWHEGVVLTLWRQDPGTWREVLAREAWKPHLRPQSFSPQNFGRKPVAVSREWLAAPATLNLAPGDYSLSVLWDGDGMVEAQALPDGGYVSAPTMRFTVKPVADEVQRAVQGHRLAFHAYTVGAMDQAWEFSRAALAVPGARGVLNSEGTPFLAANAAIKRQHYREAASLLQIGEPWQQGEPAMIMQEFRQVLSPEITLSPATLGSGPPRLTLTVLPAQTYEVQSSSDLITWVTIDHRHTDTNRYEVVDSDAHPGAPRFYRAVWLPWP